MSAAGYATEVPPGGVELVAEAMRKFGLKTKKDAVDVASGRLVGPALTTELLESVSGIGRDGDLDEIRGSRLDELGLSEATDSMEK